MHEKKSSSLCTHEKKHCITKALCKNFFAQNKVQTIDVESVQQIDRKLLEVKSKNKPYTVLTCGALLAYYRITIVNELTVLNPN